MKIKKPDLTKLGLQKPDLKKLNLKRPDFTKSEKQKTDASIDFSAMQKKLKNFDWRSLQKYTKPQAADDLNVFLEKLPQNAGQTMLIMAGISWSIAGAVGLFTAVQLQQITELRTAVEEAQALKPIVPKMINQAANAKQVADFVEDAKKIYNGLDIKASGASITISAKNTNAYGQFREALGHVQTGGSGWRIEIDKLCVGRECERFQLSASLKINTVSVKGPG